MQDLLPKTKLRRRRPGEIVVLRSDPKIVYVNAFQELYLDNIVTQLALASGSILLNCRQDSFFNANKVLVDYVYPRIDYVPDNKMETWEFVIIDPIMNQTVDLDYLSSVNIQLLPPVTTTNSYDLYRMSPPTVKHIFFKPPERNEK